MLDITFYDINLFGIFLLVTLLAVVYSKHEKYTLRGKLFRILVLLNILMLVVEIFSWMFDTLDGDMNRFWNIAANTLVTGLPVFVVSVWAIYIDYMIYTDEERTKRVYKWYLAPAIVMLLLSIVNIFVPFLFEVSADNVYSRLGGIWMSTIMAIIVYVIILREVILNRRRLTGNFLYGVMVFLVLPQIAAVIQLLVFGVLLIWATTAVAIVYSYLLFETTSSSLDYLTGIYTRIRAEDYMYTLKKKRKPFSIIMIDMDDFKIINDSYGHHIGDKTLIEMARILEEVFHKHGLVSRFGGDEFIIVIETINQGTINMYRQSIMKHMRQSTNKNINTCKFSFGVASCALTTNCSIDKLMIDADNDMYLDKAKNKNRKRRKGDK